jgi:hypothetical protein
MMVSIRVGASAGERRQTQLTNTTCLLVFYLCNLPCSALPASSCFMPTKATPKQNNKVSKPESQSASQSLLD